MMKYRRRPRRRWQLRIGRLSARLKHHDPGSQLRHQVTQLRQPSRERGVGWLAQRRDQGTDVGDGALGDGDDVRLVVGAGDTDGDGAGPCSRLRVGMGGS